MRIKILFVFTFFVFSILILACGGSDTAVNSTNTNSSAANAARNNTNNPLAVSTPAPEQTTNNAPTLTPVFKAYCAAMIKKDDAALRKVYSQDTIQYFEEEMKADGEKSLAAFLADEQVSDKLCEVRNEQIQGDNAVGEIRTEGYPNGIKVAFVKENGEWKLTNKAPNVEALKHSAANSSR
ncbi:MAG: nuclear transport factor 2 family protein [Blastocatellia bacterium]|nr:nuclear transport factor 2 family protein [Blastocatellia bacterium]